MCILFIMSVNLPMNILGMPLFVDYYSIHDPVTGLIGWAPHTTSLKDPIKAGSIPSKDQFIAVGEAPEEKDQSSMLLAWFLTALLVYIIVDYWGQFTRPEWEESLDSTQFIVLSLLFFAVTGLAAIYLVQPFLYSLVHSILGGEASAARASFFNVVSAKTIDHIVYGVVLGLAAGFILMRVLVRGAKAPKMGRCES